MSNWQSADITANGINIHYTRSGGDKPPMVLVHGFSDDGPCWTPFAEAMVDEYDIVMTDARGHGCSDAPASGYGQADMAADVAGVISGLGLDKPIIIGHSMGGATTMVLAGTYPDIPKAIIIEDAGARNVMTGENPAEDERIRQMFERMRALKAKSRDKLIADASVDHPDWSQEELEPWADSKLRFNLNALNRAGAKPVEWEAVLPNIQCPALLITADPELGAMVDADGEARLCALIPQLQVVRIQGAGHNVRREQFDAYMDAVREFLSEA